MNTELRDLIEIINNGWSPSKGDNIYFVVSKEEMIEAIKLYKRDTIRYLDIKGVEYNIPFHTFILQADEFVISFNEVGDMCIDIEGNKDNGSVEIPVAGLNESIKEQAKSLADKLDNIDIYDLTYSGVDDLISDMRDLIDNINILGDRQ